MLLTFLVPIGYFGTVAIDRHVYTWFSTADSIRMEYFIIERMLFIFYFAYLSLSLVSVIVHWHGGLELFKGAISSVKKIPKSSAMERVVHPMLVQRDGSVLNGARSI